MEIYLVTVSRVDRRELNSTKLTHTNAHEEMNEPLFNIEMFRFRNVPSIHIRSLVQQENQEC